MAAEEKRRSTWRNRDQERGRREKTEREGTGGREQTGVELVLGFASLDEDFEVDEAERHQAERETGHDAGEHDETDTDHKVHPEHRRAARLVAPCRRHPGLCLLLPLYPAPALHSLLVLTSRFPPSLSTSRSVN